MHARRWWTRVAGGFLTLAALTDVAPCAPFRQGGAGSRPAALVNGGMEELDADGNLVGWFVPGALLQAGYVIGAEFDDRFRGETAARLDSREVNATNQFGNLMQAISAEPYREKRVRYRAAVKVADAGAGGQAQMWLRVDLGGGPNRVGFFDNMGERPILSGEWKTYEIVGDVAADAQSIALGVMCLGQCLVLVDEASLEVVDEKVGATGDSLASAPTQPFFTRWLLLPIVALALFGLGLLATGRVGKFAFEFTLVYWALYAVPTLVSTLVPVWGQAWNLAYEAGPVDAVVRWTAANVLGIERELVPSLGNGSGDTTHSYVQALVSLVLSLALAAIWSLVDRRATDHARLKDLLRGGLRYYLAVMMLSYGLAKLGEFGNQFSAPGPDRLADTYGASSPMGLLWTFMGSSRAYTGFAGAMETLAGVLIALRRTALLGALATVGVMLNVMLLNFCYDTPVKLFSFHLVVAAACVALPDAPRLAQVFLGLGPGAAPTVAPPLTGRRKWVRRVLKAYVVVMVLVLPIFLDWRGERAIADVMPALGTWKLATLEADGQAIAPGPGEVESLTLSTRAVQAEDRWTTGFYAELGGGTPRMGTATLTADTLQLAGAGGGRLVSGDFTWHVEGDELRLEAPALRATFAPASRDYLLTRRGFRWISERPFNR